MICSSETLQNLLYFMYKKTHVVFFLFHYIQLYIFPYKCPGLCRYRPGHQGSQYLLSIVQGTTRSCINRFIRNTARIRWEGKKKNLKLYPIQCKVTSLITKKNLFCIVRNMKILAQYKSCTSAVIFDDFSRFYSIIYKIINL